MLTEDRLLHYIATSPYNELAGGAPIYGFEDVGFIYKELDVWSQDLNENILDIKRVLAKLKSDKYIKECRRSGIGRIVELTNAGYDRWRNYFSSQPPKKGIRPMAKATKKKAAKKAPAKKAPAKKAPAKKAPAKKAPAKKAPATKVERPKQNGVVRPREGSKTGRLWDAFDELARKLRRPPTRKEAVEKGESMNANPTTAGCQFRTWCIFNNCYDPRPKKSSKKAD